jgi:hypothetical protein
MGEAAQLVTHRASAGVLASPKRNEAASANSAARMKAIARSLLVNVSMPTPTASGWISRT